MSFQAYRSFIKSAERIRADFPRPALPGGWGIGSDFRSTQAAAFLLIDLNDLWGHFCRTLVLDIACGRAVNSGGVKILPTAGPVTLQQAMAKIVNKRGHEPKWHQALEANNALSRFPGPANNQIQLALALASSPAPAVNTVRNYFAHRRSECREKLQQASFYDNNMRFCPFRLGNFLRSDGRSQLDFWIDEFRVISSACVV